MAGDYLFDTNVAIVFMAGEPTVRERVVKATSVATSFVVLGELYFGALKSAKRAENLARVEKFRHDVPVIGWDGETARRYGAPPSHCRSPGDPLPCHHEEGGDPLPTLWAASRDAKQRVR